MRTLKTEGIIIKRRNSGEADRFVTIFTKDLGKITVKAQGVRRIASKRSSHIELLNHSVLSLYKGAKYPTLIEVQTIQDFSVIKADLDKVGYAYHICELIDGLCPENQENDAIYLLLKKTIEQLATAEDMPIFMHGFEVELLTLLGFWYQTAEAARNLDTHNFIEGLLERRLKSHKIFAKLQ